MRTETIKLLVADDHTLFRQGIIKLLEEHKEYEVIAEAENGKDLMEKYFKNCPDIILTDIAMPELTGIQAVEEILKRDRNAKALFLSMYDTEEYVYHVLKSGGMGLVNKNILDEELVYAISKVSNGEKYFGKNWNDASLSLLFQNFEKKFNEEAKHLIDLNFREEQILQMIIEGNTSKEMADKMLLSKKTIDYYRSNLLRKFDIKTQIELIKYGILYFSKRNSEKTI
ncbi:MAG: response regulator transcription factor [Ignavibacteriaceae bacterium]|nr:response regulator transcription factor [Ignavibacteriaceae bacterium]